jgi:hypothetical protein
VKTRPKINLTGSVATVNIQEVLEQINKDRKEWYELGKAHKTEGMAISDANNLNSSAYFDGYEGRPFVEIGILPPDPIKEISNEGLLKSVIDLNFEWGNNFF